MGRIADHHKIKPDWPDTLERAYTHAEQLVRRDIDPTVLARRPSTELTDPRLPRPWFSPAVATFPAQATDDNPEGMAGVPDPLDLIAVTDDGGVRWLVLISAPTSQESQPLEDCARGLPKLAIWTQLKAYVVPVADVARLSEWAIGQNWDGHWMEYTPVKQNVLVGAQPNDPEWRSASGEVNWMGRAAQPCELLECAVWYHTSRDAATDGDTRGYVVPRRLHELLGLGRGIDFFWRDGSGIAVYDPSFNLGGPASLVMRRDAVERLARNGLSLFWTVLVGKQLSRGDLVPSQDDYPSGISASASYLLQGDRIRQIGATARLRPLGRETEQLLTWATRPAEP